MADEETRLEIVGLVHNQAVTGAYGLVLQEVGGRRRFSVIIGEAEAQSIAMKIHGRELPRPLTHDLMNHILHVLDARLEKALISDLVDDVFHAELHIACGDGRRLKVSARTSDAVALAVRADCPIYIRSSILDVVGTEVHARERLATLDDVEAADDHDIRLLAREDLEAMLEQAVGEERYELAARLKHILELKQ